MTRSLTNDLPGFPSVGCCHYAAYKRGWSVTVWPERTQNVETSSEKLKQLVKSALLFISSNRDIFSPCLNDNGSLFFYTKYNERPMPDPKMFNVILQGIFKAIDMKQTFDALSRMQKINQSNDWIIISSAIN